MAKRQVNAQGSPGVKAPEPPKSAINEYDRMMSFMVDEMAQRFRNQVFEELHQDTIAKFSDAQPGNFAKVFLRLAKRVRRKLLKQFDDERLEKLAKRVTGKVNSRNRRELYQRISKATGVDTKELIQSEGLTFRINAMQLEVAQWSKKLRDETLENFTANSLRVMSEGGSLETVLDEFAGMEEKWKNHAKTVARTEIANFNSLTTKLRAERLGITKARWVTSQDERVRPCHQKRNGKEFNLDGGLYSSCDGKKLLPGQDYNCRCDYELIIPEPESD